MTWDDSRKSATGTTIVRHVAHSDDTKRRSDESTQVRPRARWLVPVLAAAVVVVIIGGIAVAVRSGGDQPGAGPAAGPNPTFRSSTDAGRTRAAEPAKQVSYKVDITCVHKSVDAGDCSEDKEYNMYVFCPEQTCSIAIAVNIQVPIGAPPGPSQFVPNSDPDALEVTFAPGQASFQGKKKVSKYGCYDLESISGALNPDGTYTVHLRDVLNACRSGSANVFLVTLTPVP